MEIVSPAIPLDVLLVLQPMSVRFAKRGILLIMLPALFFAQLQGVSHAAQPIFVQFA